MLPAVNGEGPKNGAFRWSACPFARALANSVNSKCQFEVGVRRRMPPPGAPTTKKKTRRQAFIARATIDKKRCGVVLSPWGQV